MRLCQSGLYEGFSMVDVKIAYDIFPIGSMGFFFDAMHYMRTSYIKFLKENPEKEVSE